MDASQKLTKKQKKALAFREQRGKRSTTTPGDPTTTTSTKSKRPRAKDDLAEMEARAIPVMEEQDDAGDHGDSAQVARDADAEGSKEGHDNSRGQEKRGQGSGERKREGKGEKGSLRVAEPVVKKSGKRKRGGKDGEEDGDEDEEKTSKWKSKGAKDRSDEATEADKPSGKRRKVAGESGGTKGEASSKQRFILFVGNLKYTTPKEAIEAHFANCDPPPTIRLLTQKNPTSNVQKAKSKGCAFVEFSHRNALQQGLKLHHSTLDGRMINVELTAGGGGKSDARLSKVKERNKALATQRTERLEKAAANSDVPVVVSKPQRYSATSGAEQVPVAKRTWSVGDGDSGVKKRGKKKREGKSTMPWTTGVNSIPVG